MLRYLHLFAVGRTEMKGFWEVAPTRFGTLRWTWCHTFRLRALDCALVANLWLEIAALLPKLGGFLHFDELHLPLASVLSGMTGGLVTAGWLPVPLAVEYHAGSDVMIAVHRGRLADTFVVWAF